MQQWLRTVLVACAVMVAQPLYAQDSSVVSPVVNNAAEVERADAQELSVAQNSGVTLSQAVAQVRRQYGGRIVSAETRRNGNREVHHIKVLTSDGKVKTVTVPGRSLRSRG